MEADRPAGERRSRGHRWCPRPLEPPSLEARFRSSP